MECIKRIDFNHRGSFNVDKIINLINKLERKFGEFINQVRLRSTVEGKGFVRVSKPNFENKTVMVLLPHKYTNKNMQAKILLSFNKNLTLDIINSLEQKLRVYEKFHSIYAKFLSSHNLDHELEELR